MNLCRCGCGKDVGKSGCNGLARSCYKRWLAQDKPEPPGRPLTPQECGRRSGEARQPEADAYDLEYARLRRERMEAEPDNRVFRAAAWAADLARAVQARDRYGVTLVFGRLSDAPAALIAFAACADPDLLMAGPDDGEQTRRSA